VSRKEKLIGRFLEQPKDFTWDELKRLVKGFGFSEMKPGKTGGSRKRFKNSEGLVIRLHKPHPGNIVKGYALRDLKDILIREGLLIKKE